MSKVLIDISPVQWKVNGSGIYTRMIVEEAIKRGYHFDAFYVPSIGLDTSIKEFLLKKDISLISLDNISNVIEYVESKKYEKIYFGSELNSGVNLPSSITPIITIHDLRFIEVPNDKTRYLYRRTPFQRIKQWGMTVMFPNYNSFLQKRNIQRLIKHPKLQIVTVSNHTRYSILQTFSQISPERINVFYCPYPKPVNVDLIEYDDRFLKENALEEKQFFLIISAGRWFKNSYRAIRALDNLATKGKFGNKKVVVIGLAGGEKIVNVKNGDKFIFSGNVSNSALQSLYKNAFCFLYPSLQEGFGIPPLEAMRYSTPVVVSATTAIPEICGDGAVYFNPYSILEIQNRIFQLINDVEFYNEMKERAIRRYRQISERQKTDLDKLLHFIFE